jgi:hypothetical protein
MYNRSSQLILHRNKHSLHPHVVLVVAAATTQALKELKLVVTIAVTLSNNLVVD